MILEQKNNKVIMAIVAWTDIDVHTMVSLLATAKHPAILSCQVGRGALLPHARNDSLRGIYRNTLQNKEDFTHVLFIDGDIIRFDHSSLELLLEADKDIIGGVYSQREPPFRPVIRPENDEEFCRQMSLPAEERTPFQVLGLGFGITLIKKKVLDAIAEKTESGYIWFNLDRRPRKSFEREVNELFEKVIERGDSPEKIFGAGVQAGLCAHHHTDPVGEDYNFCERAHRFGFETWVHPNVQVGHVGRVEYDIRDWTAVLKAEGNDIDKMTSRLLKGSWLWRKEESDGMVSSETEKL